MRIISHVGFFDHTEPLFSTLQIMDIYQIKQYMCCIFMYKHNKAMLPTLFNDVFVLSPMTHKYSTRQKFAYKIPFCRTKCRQLSLAYVGPKIWNTLILDNCLQYSATKSVIYYFYSECTVIIRCFSIIILNIYLNTTLLVTYVHRCI